MVRCEWCCAYNTFLPTRARFGMYSKVFFREKLRDDKGLEIMKKENEYGRDTPLKDLHTSLVENFTFRFIQLNKIDEHKQDEIKEYLKMCASNEETSSEVKLDLIDEISKGDNGEIEKLHPKVQIYLEDPNKVPGGANRKFEVIKNNN